jgi:hypothetical protein
MPRKCKCSNDPNSYLKIIWSNMLQRCENPKHPSFRFYGGATPPVTVFSFWHHFETFRNDILRLIGPRPAGIRSDGRSEWELDRRNPKGSYTPDNVRWLHWQKNQANKRPRKRRQQQSIADSDPYRTDKLPWYMISNSSGMFLNTSYACLRS